MPAHVAPQTVCCKPNVIRVNYNNNRFHSSRVLIYPAIPTDITLALRTYRNLCGQIVSCGTVFEPEGALSAVPNRKYFTEVHSSWIVLRC